MCGEKREGRDWLAIEQGVKAQDKVSSNCDPGDKRADKLSRGENKTLPLRLEKKSRDENLLLATVANSYLKENNFENV